MDEFNVLDPRCFGQPLTMPGKELRWSAHTQYRNPRSIPQVIGFHSGAIVSPKAREIIEQHQAPNVEFIPLDIYHKNTDELIAEWWFLNVFNWKKVFDLTRSRASYRDYPFTGGLAQIDQRFGAQEMFNMEYLEVDVEQTRDPFFLAEVPSTLVWNNVFVSNRLRRELDRAVMKKDRSFTRAFDNFDEWPGKPASFLMAAIKQTDEYYLGAA